MKRFFIVLGLCASPLTAHAQERQPNPNDPVRVAVADDRSRLSAPTFEPLSPLAPCAAQMDAESLRSLVIKEARNAGVDEKLALVIMSLESSDGAKLNSAKGAKGPMQLMPETAADYGVKDICNPVENVQGAMKFLKDLSEQFGGNVMLIAAAYNAGSERVYDAGGVPANAETVRYTANAFNQYYGLGDVARRPSEPKARRAAEPRAHPQATVRAKEPGGSGQNWIGGTVLYVTREGEGE